MKHYRGEEQEVLFTHTMLQQKCITCATFFSYDPFKVSGSRLRRPGTRDGQVRVPQKRVGVPPSCQEAKGRLPERHPVHVEVWQDGGHVLPHSRLRRLGSRQRELPDTSQVGFSRTWPPRALSALPASVSTTQVLRQSRHESTSSLDLQSGSNQILVKMLPI